MKYDFEMETDESTSVGKIVAQIKENSDVLEFGPGNGRMSVNFQQMPFMAILMKMIGSNTLLVRRLIISFLRMCWNI